MRCTSSAKSAPRVAASIVRLTVLPQKPFTVACLKMRSPAERVSVPESIDPNDTRVPPSPSSESRSPAAFPPTESTAARGAPSPRIAAACRRQSSEAVETTSRMPSSASSETPASRRTRPRTRTPRAAANWARSLPTAPLAAFCAIQSPGCTSSESSRLRALNGIEMSCAAVSSLIASGTGISPAAFATKYSLHTPKVPPVATR